MRPKLAALVLLAAGVSWAQSAPQAPGGIVEALWREQNALWSVATAESPGARGRARPSPDRRGPSPTARAEVGAGEPVRRVDQKSERGLAAQQEQQHGARG